MTTPTLLWTREFRYHLTNYRRTWRGSAMSSVLGPLMYLTAMGVGLGTLVNRHGTAHLHGHTYLVFIAPGLLATTAMQCAIFESTYPVLGGVKWKRNYFGALHTPLGAGSLMAGHLAYITFRVASTTLAYLAVMAAFGAVHSPLVLLAWPGAVLTGTAFAAPVMAWSITRTRDTAFNVVFRFVMIPLFLFSGTFYPISQLPAGVRPIAYATPLWHGVDLCRTLTLGTATPGMTALHVGYLLAVTGAGLAVARITYRRRLYS
jgi:lipooligosaccharide transport system permease protein